MSKARAFAFSTLAECILLSLFVVRGSAQADDPAGGQAGRSGVLAVVDAHVVTMESPQILEHRTILIRDGRIAEIGPAAETRVPEGALRIDGRGRYLMPGVIDCFCHVDGVATLLPYLANGVTTVRNTAGGYTTHLGIRDRVARGELLGPTILSTGGDITSNPPNFNIQEPVTTPELAARVVAEMKRLGFDGIMVYSRISPVVQQSVVQAAKRLGLPVTGHASLGQRLRETAQSGQRSVDNLIGMVRLSTGEIGYSDDMAHRAARLLREGGVSCIPTLTVRQARSGKPLAQPAERSYFAPSMRGDLSAWFKPG
jgi:imidazolonepropionase-like amidohydrolase